MYLPFHIVKICSYVWSLKLKFGKGRPNMLCPNEDHVISSTNDNNCGNFFLEYCAILACWVIFHVFSCHLLIFFKIILFFFKNSLRNTTSLKQFGSRSGLILSKCSNFILPILQPNTGCFPIQKRPVISQFWRFFPT